ncbi:INO80 complex subunit C-like [Littorina saxatilis]|uniref:Vps72/YL1 C-terminal domain-containing protein n=1 Tax=Littorina saxatilis TaxID=31220 RepID=A0AAN9BRY3_9CAEN
MASTRKSSRVRVPKIKEDAATPTKRSKTNSAAVPAATTTVSPATPPVSVIVKPQTVLEVPAAATTSFTAISIVSSTPIPMVVESVAGAGMDDTDVSNTGTPDPAADDMAEEKTATAVFKDPNFVHSSIGAAGSKRTRVWKNLKQIITTERSLPWEPTDVTYSSIEGPPSFKPAKKYSDLSGLEALYTDPQTKLRYATADEFTRARTLPSDLVTGYLALRKASGPVP